MMIRRSVCLAIFVAAMFAASATAAIHVTVRSNSPGHITIYVNHGYWETYRVNCANPKPYVVRVIVSGTDWAIIHRCGANHKYDIS